MPTTTAVTAARPAHLARHRLSLSDGARTTLHVAAYALASTTVRVVHLDRAQPLEAWCADAGVDEAIAGGFFVRGGARDEAPLGQLRVDGAARDTVPFDPPWHDVRACVHAPADDGPVRIARRPDLPATPTGDLLQAGPLLVSGGVVATVAGEDPEGFSAGARQFDSDITDGRHPRAALATTTCGTRVLAVACDGRAHDEAGLTLPELATALVELGADAALNLDGGGSTSLICAGRLQNVPRSDWEEVVPGGRPLPTAIAFVPRAA